MKKYTNKKVFSKAWTYKLQQSKNIYDEVRKENPKMPGFYYSDIYRNLKRKKNKAEYRYDNRQIIAEQRKQRREKHKELVSNFKESGAVRSVYDGTAINAFKGGRGRGDKKLIEMINAKNFTGLIEINNGEWYSLKDHYEYFTKVKFFKKVSEITALLFNKTEDSYIIFETEVEKRMWFDAATNTLYYQYIFTLPDAEQ